MKNVPVYKLFAICFNLFLPHRILRRTDRCTRTQCRLPFDLITYKQHVATMQQPASRIGSERKETSNMINKY